MIIAEKARGFGAGALTTKSWMTPLAPIVTVTPEEQAANQLASALDVLRSMRARITNVYAGVEQYQLVMATPNNQSLDTYSKTFRALPDWKVAWDYVGSVIGQGMAAFPQPGLTLTEATRIIDQVLLYWGDKKLAELRAAATKAAADAAAQAKVAAEQAARVQAEADAAAARAKAEADDATARAAAEAAAQAAVEKAAADAVAAAKAAAELAAKRLEAQTQAAKTKKAWIIAGAVTAALAIGVVGVIKLRK